MDKRPNYEHNAYHMPLDGIPVQETDVFTTVTNVMHMIVMDVNTRVRRNKSELSVSL